MSDEQVNSAIDEVARQMTEEAPPAGADFRRRVLARIASNEAPRASWRAAFVLSPIAVAAAVAIVMMSVRKPGPLGPNASQPTPTVASVPAEAAGPAEARVDSTRANVDEPVRRVAWGFPLDGARSRQPRERGPEGGAPQKADVLEPPLQADSISLDSEWSE